MCNAESGLRISFQIKISRCLFAKEFTSQIGTIATGSSTLIYWLLFRYLAHHEADLVSRPKRAIYQHATILRVETEVCTARETKTKGI